MYVIIISHHNLHDQLNYNFPLFLADVLTNKFVILTILIAVYNYVSYMLIWRDSYYFDAECEPNYHQILSAGCEPTMTLQEI